FKWIKGHSNHQGNNGADKLAGDGARKPTANAIDLSIDPKWNLTGMKLTAVTQARAYKALSAARKHPPMRLSTIITLDMIRHAVKDLTDHLPTDSRIWQSFRHTDHSPKVTDFLFKATHGTFMIGKRWAHIPNYEHRAICPICDTDDSLDHALTECSAPGQAEVWKCVKSIWLKKHSQWEKPTLGMILGSTLAHFRSPKGTPLPGVDRLYRIMIPESAYFIWKLRCERVVGGVETHNPTEIQRRWRAMMNERLALDQALTHPRLGKAALQRKVVLRTWSYTLQNELFLPDDWIKYAGVLVGIDLPEHRRRYREPP
ncbi:hypothetical protein NEOLEDRAFT_1072088, partial [Neolentinus lepideus HHB14362 ss-1]